MKPLILTFIAISALSIDASSAELKGTVKSASGKPLAHVFIFYGRSLEDIAETDDDGVFSIPRHGRVIFFRRNGFKPLTKIVDSSTTRLDVVLEDAKPTEWLIQSCSNASDSEKRVGFSLRLPIPEEAIVSGGSDIDHSYFSIGYGREENRVWLSGIGEGPYASLGVPREEWILNSKEFTERTYGGEEAEGTDMRGQLNDGTYWRFIGRLGEQMTYKGLSKEQAAFFDRIIDKVCIR